MSVALTRLGPSVALDVPVEPDAEQARAWLTAELLDPAYNQRPSLLMQALEWFMRQLNEAGEVLTGIDPVRAAVVVLSVAATAALIAFLVAGPVRRARRAARASVDVLADDTRSAAQLRADADAHAAAGRFAEAVLDRFRAILRSLEERAVLDPLPGRTADEAAGLAASRLPQHAGDLRRAGLLFDDVAYGDVVPDGPAAQWLRDLDRSVEKTRPELPVGVGR
ncbi:MAG TPA: DUF4129 domain-containing protein [Actinotalea sp.]|nr:DUF4129 domain-containing protein [Actinotalea sp.]